MKLRDAVLAGLKAEFDSVLKQQADLNREMIRLPIDARCKQWKDYYTRLGYLAMRRQRIEIAAAFFGNHTTLLQYPSRN